MRLSNLILRKWNSVKVLSEKIFKYSLLKIQILKSSLTTKKQEHIIICGPDIKGSSILHDVIRNSTSRRIINSKKNISALNSFNLFKKCIVTYEPTDLFSVNEIHDLLSKFRKLKFIIVIKDSKKLLTEVHRDIPWQYYQSWDFGFYTTPHPSFTRPGVGKAFDEIDKMKENANIQYKVIRYEDLLAEPDNIQAEISSFTDIDFEKSFSDYLFNSGKLKNTTHESIQTNNKHTAISNIDANQTDRINTLHQLFPEIQDRMKEYGYFEDLNVSRSKSEGLQPKNGTVVGMYTPDDTYRNEAKRMVASLDRLGINHSIDELPPVEEIAMIENPGEYPDWFVQKLARFYKSTWLKQKMEQLNGPILYCDVDAFFHKDPWPYLSLYDGDAAVFSDRNGIIISSTIWLNDTAGALKLIALWEEQCKAKRLEVINSWPDVIPSTSDQPILKDIVDKNKITSSIHIQQLPPTMLYIFDKNDDTSMDDVFIEQLQASRVAKSKFFNKQKINKPSSRDRRIKELESIL